MFVSHARTPEEFKAEVLSHLHQRIASNEGYSRIVARNASEKTRLAAVTAELQGLVQFFEELVIIRPKRNRSPGPVVIEAQK